MNNLQKYVVEKKLNIESIINYEGKEALEAVKKNGYALRYVLTSMTIL